MPDVTFQVLEGVDKGRTFRNLPTPVTIGREEGNSLRLNDERVSRFHAKVQLRQRRNHPHRPGKHQRHPGQRQRGADPPAPPGDRIGVGRSLLLFGSEKPKSPSAWQPSTAASAAGREDPPIAGHRSCANTLASAVRSGRDRLRPERPGQDHLHERHSLPRQPPAAAAAA